MARYEDLTVTNLTVCGELVLKDTTWDDLRFPAQSVNPPGEVTDPTWDTTDIGWTFDDNKTSILHLIGQLPHSYKEGTSIYPHLHWRAQAAGIPLWRLEYKWFNNGSIDPADFTSVDIEASVFTWSSGNLAQVSAFPVLSGTGMEKSSVIIMKLSRLGSDLLDTYTGDVLLREFDLHFEMDSVGSDLERPPFG